jgi:SpoVK/Ycf46/Vps4 family AAA+-type ATPase
MLFLTTNRVGAFDDAFVSRIHVKLYYPPLKNEERQKIWSSFIDKLARERSKDFRVTLNAKEYIEGSTIKSLDLNGREIRNAFQTAVALAEYDGKLDEEGKIMIEDHHLKQVAEMTREFQRYLNKLHGECWRDIVNGRELMASQVETRTNEPMGVLNGCQTRVFSSLSTNLVGRASLSELSFT